MENISVGYGDAATWGSVVSRNDPRWDEPELTRECVMAVLRGESHADELGREQWQLVDQLQEHGFTGIDDLTSMTEIVELVASKPASAPVTMGLLNLAINRLMGES